MFFTLCLFENCSTKLIAVDLYWFDKCHVAFDSRLSTDAQSPRLYVFVGLERFAGVCVALHVLDARQVLGSLALSCWHGLGGNCLSVFNHIFDQRLLADYRRTERARRSHGLFARWWRSGQAYLAALR